MFQEDENVPAAADAFASADVMLVQGLNMLQARQKIREMGPEELEQKGAGRKLLAHARKWADYWHQSLTMSAESIPLAAHLVKYRLNRIEREVVLVLLLRHLSLIRQKSDECGELLTYIVLTPMELMKALRLLNEDGRLARRGLVVVGNEDEPPPMRELFLDPMLATMVMTPDQTPSSGWPVKNEEALYNYLHRLAKAFEQKADTMRGLHHGYGSKSEVFKWQRHVQYLMDGLAETLGHHPDWHLSKLRKEFRWHSHMLDEEWSILLVLLCKELGHVRVDDHLFSGIGLLRAACSLQRLPHRSHNLLSASADLRAGQWMQPCGGTDTFMSDNPQDLEGSEFELTPKALEMLGLLNKKAARHAKSSCELIQPTIRMEDLVLSKETQACLKQALAQSLHAHVLFQEWGLGGRITYGKGTTMMFYGSPGTGKTAAAQALAHALEKPLLIADYSQIQNCFVGQTEKNIVRIFREAGKCDAVLFWDEADAMFFDRDMAMRTWEVRDVNVLLQELERFEGTCILATNRLTALDKALERRISLKVKFDRPDRAARHEIFLRLLPRQMPLAADVDINRLAAKDLSGGEIKNAILNAARCALVRSGPQTSVCMQDFQEAIDAITKGAWTRKTERAIGFTP